MTPGEITFVVLTKNEAENLPKALASVPAGAHKLVVDAESSDATVEVARRSGAEVFVRPWPGFVTARAEAARMVRSAWTFMLDADEVMDETLRRSLAAAAPSADVRGYAVRRATYFCGRQISGAGWGNERLLRLFRTGTARLEAKPAAGGAAQLHERWLVDGEAPELAGTLLHYSYPTVASYREKFARYTDLEAAGIAARPLDVARAWVVAPARFLWLLGARGALRDGWRGAYVALFSALYPAVVAAKSLARRAR